jgi:hypothetical protein
MLKSVTVQLYSERLSTGSDNSIGGNISGCSNHDNCNSIHGNNDNDSNSTDENSGIVVLVVDVAVSSVSSWHVACGRDSTESKE